MRMGTTEFHTAAAATPSKNLYKIRLYYIVIQQQKRWYFVHINSSELCEIMYLKRYDRPRNAAVFSTYSKNANAIPHMA